MEFNKTSSVVTTMGVRPSFVINRILSSTKQSIKSPDVIARNIKSLIEILERLYI